MHVLSLRFTIVYFTPLMFDDNYPILESNPQQNYFACELNCVLSRLNNVAINLNGWHTQKLHDIRSLSSLISIIVELKIMAKYMNPDLPQIWGWFRSLSSILPMFRSSQSILHCIGWNLFFWQAETVFLQFLNYKKIVDK